ncbi:hypothetical protein FPV67DRAFT_386105 [Lyophyllum atratum]|nr:hypothetical protein FPV67DRAFT_386105 [Lyophyllum atratum]
MEIVITGGEEEGLDNSIVDNTSLYTQPEDIYDVYEALNKVSPNFSIAAAFGNIHGVYKPGNVKLHPDLLGKHQMYASEKINHKVEKPLWEEGVSKSIQRLQMGDADGFYATG